MQFCLFMGASTGNKPEFIEAACSLGRVLATQNIGVVYGGGDVGLMGKMANAVVEVGGNIVGVIPNRLRWVEKVSGNHMDMIYVDTLEERKTIMLERSDAFLALPGGIGTLDEIMTVIAWNELKYQNKPLGLLNTLGYYDTFIGLLRHQQANGFLHDEKLIERLVVCEEVEDLVAQLRQTVNTYSANS